MPGGPEARLRRDLDDHSNAVGRADRAADDGDRLGDIGVAGQRQDEGGDDRYQGRDDSEPSKQPGLGGASACCTVKRPDIQSCEACRPGAGLGQE